MMDTVTNVVFAGIGGQGVIRASDILADAAFRCGFDVKKAEIHGMSQRGGSVTSDVRFGPRVLSPMIPAGQAHFLVVLRDDQVESNRHVLRPTGTLLLPSLIDESKLASRKSLNVALLGTLSQLLHLPRNAWLDAITASLPEKLHDANLAAFDLGCAAASLQSKALAPEPTTQRRQQ